MLCRELSSHLEALPSNHAVCLKLTLPSDSTLYEKFTVHPKVMRVFALSGGYSRNEAVAKLNECKGMSASFSRALTEGLRVDQTADQFEATLDKAVNDIFHASCT